MVAEAQADLVNPSNPVKKLEAERVDTCVRSAALRSPAGTGSWTCLPPLDPGQRSHGKHSQLRGLVWTLALLQGHLEVEPRAEEKRERPGQGLST